MPELLVGTFEDAVFLAFACFDEDGGFVEVVLVFDVDVVATGLAEAAADTFVGINDGDEESGAGDGEAVFADFRAFPALADGVIAGGLAFDDAEVTGFFAGEGEAGVKVDNGQSHFCHFLFLHREGADGAGRADLSAGVAAGFTTCPVRDDFGCPEGFEAMFQAVGLEEIVGAGLEAFATTDAHIEELWLGHTSRRADGRGCVAGAAEDGGQGNPSCGRGCRSRCKGEEASPTKRGLMGGRVVGFFQVLGVPACRRT